MLTQILAVAVGGAVGAVGRFLISKGTATYIGGSFPYGTLFVNVTGSFVLGVVTGLSTTRLGLPPTARLAIAIGFCGAFTTFSTFAVETLNQQSFRLALLNVVLNNATAIVAAVIGLGLTATIRPGP